jgi:hypothetical protein
MKIILNHFLNFLKSTFNWSLRIFVTLSQSLKQIILSNIISITWIKFYTFNTKKVIVFTGTSFANIINRLLSLNKINTSILLIILKLIFHFWLVSLSGITFYYFPINSLHEIVTNLLNSFNASFIQILKPEEIIINYPSDIESQLDENSPSMALVLFFITKNNLFNKIKLFIGIIWDKIYTFVYIKKVIIFTGFVSIISCLVSMFANVYLKIELFILSKINWYNLNGYISKLNNYIYNSILLLQVSSITFSLCFILPFEIINSDLLENVDYNKLYYNSYYKKCEDICNEKVNIYKTLIDNLNTINDKNNDSLTNENELIKFIIEKINSIDLYNKLYINSGSSKYGILILDTLSLNYNNLIEICAKELNNNNFIDISHLDFKANIIQYTELNQNKDIKLELNIPKIESNNYIENLEISPKKYLSIKSKSEFELYLNLINKNNPALSNEILFQQLYSEWINDKVVDNSYQEINYYDLSEEEKKYLKMKTHNWQSNLSYLFLIFKDKIVNNFVNKLRMNKLVFVIVTKKLFIIIKCYIKKFIKILYSIIKDLITLYLYMLIFIIEILFNFIINLIILSKKYILNIKIFIYDLYYNNWYYLNKLYNIIIYSLLFFQIIFIFIYFFIVPLYYLDSNWFDFQSNMLPVNVSSDEKKFWENFNESEWQSYLNKNIPNNSTYESNGQSGSSLITTNLKMESFNSNNITPSDAYSTQMIYNRYPEPSLGDFNNSEGLVNSQLGREITNDEIPSFELIELNTDKNLHDLLENLNKNKNSLENWVNLRKKIESIEDERRGLVALHKITNMDTTQRMKYEDIKEKLNWIKRIIYQNTKRIRETASYRKNLEEKIEKIQKAGIAVLLLITRKKINYKNIQLKLKSLELKIKDLFKFLLPIIIKLIIFKLITILILINIIKPIFYIDATVSLVLLSSIEINKSENEIEDYKKKNWKYWR